MKRAADAGSAEEADAKRACTDAPAEEAAANGAAPEAAANGASNGPASWLCGCNSLGGSFSAASTPKFSTKH